MSFKFLSISKTVVGISKKKTKKDLNVFAAWILATYLYWCVSQTYITLIHTSIVFRLSHWNSNLYCVNEKIDNSERAENLWLVFLLFFFFVGCCLCCLRLRTIFFVFRSFRFDLSHMYKWICWLFVLLL